MAVICTDAGHGDRDSGAAWMGVLEKDLNLTMTHSLNDLLKERGHQVYTTRLSDTKVPDLMTRCNLINEHHRNRDPWFDAIISIHCNAAAYRDPNSGVYKAKESARGFYAIYSRDSLQGSDLTQKIAESVAREGIVTRHDGMMSTTQLGRSLAWIHRTLPPAVLLEIGFMTNPEELRLLQDLSYQRRVIKAVVNGLQKYLDVYNR